MDCLIIMPLSLSNMSTQSLCLWMYSMSETKNSRVESVCKVSKNNLTHFLGNPKLLCCNLHYHNQLFQTLYIVTLSTMRKPFFLCFLLVLFIGTAFPKSEKGRSFYIPKDKGGVCLVGRQHDLVSHTLIVRDATVTACL